MEKNGKHRIHHLIVTIFRHWLHNKHDFFLKICVNRFGRGIVCTIPNCRYHRRIIHNDRWLFDTTKNKSSHGEFEENLPCMYGNFNNNQKLDSKIDCVSLRLDEKRDFFAFLMKANVESESFWPTYLKYVVAGFFLSSAANCAVSVLYLRIMNRDFDVKYLYHPYKVVYVVVSKNVQKLLFDDHFFHILVPLGSKPLQLDICSR